MVSLFIPADLPAASTTSASTSAATSTGCINTTRPPSAQQAPASASTASSASQPAPAVTNLTGKKHWLMHDELHALLPDAVYTALDSNAHLPADKRLKLQEACKKSSTSALFDPKKSFIDVFYHQIRNGIQGCTARAPPLSRGGRGRTGDQTIASPMP
jgi:hypothetical protein